MQPEALLVPPASSPLPPSFIAIEVALHNANPNTVHLTIPFTFVLHRADANDFATYAIVNGGGFAFAAGSEICVDGWPVILISADSPIGRAVRSPAAVLGDCVTVRLPSESSSTTFKAQIVSWNGSAVLTDTERTDCRETQAQRVRDVQRAHAEQRKRAALRAKEDGTVANLRARRLAVEAALRNR